MKVVNLPTSTKKGLASRSAKPKSAKNGVDVFGVCSNIVPSKGGLPPIGNIVLEKTRPPSTRARSTRRFVVAKSRPPMPRQLTDAPLSSRIMATRGRHLPQPHLPLPRGEYVISNFFVLFILVICCAFLWLIMCMCLLFLWQSKHKDNTSAA